MENPNSNLSLEDLKLLALLEQKKSLSLLSSALQRDKSVISRKLKTLSEKSRSIEKIGNKWRLTEIGKQLSQLAQEFESETLLVLKKPARLTIASTRLFVSAFLAPRLLEIQSLFENRTLHLLSHDGRPEQLILDGICDLAFVCGKPNDPSVAFKQAVREPFFAFAAVSFCKRYKAHDFISLQKTPFIAFSVPSGQRLFSNFLTDATPVQAVINDPMAILQAVEKGQGWSVLPYYAIQKGVQRGELCLFEDGPAEVEQYGVWWLRSRKSNSNVAAKALEWLRSHRLEP